MAKRIILAVLLLAVFGAVSYIKSVRGTSGDESRSAVGRDSSAIMQDGRVRMAGYQTTVDSLRRMIDAQDSIFADSLRANRLTWGRTVDSLFEILDSLDCLVDEFYLAQAADSSNSGGVDSTVVPVDSTELAAAEARRAEIVEHYRRLYHALPDDLSDYERRVALYEIRLKTARHFDISLGSLKDMRSESGLSY